MKLKNKLYEFEVEVSPIVPNRKEELKSHIKWAKSEIKEWQQFLKLCQKKLKSKN